MVSGRYPKSVRTVVGASAAAYGYTLTIWTTGAVLLSARGIPSTLETFMFAVGAILGFAGVAVLAFKGVEKRFVAEPPRVALWASFHFLPVGLAIVASALLARHVPDPLVWSAAPLVSTAAYLLLVGAQFALANERGLGGTQLNEVASRTGGSTNL